MEFEEYKEGEIVRLDANFVNTSLVTVQHQTPNRMFTNIESNGVRWDVMTNRLTKIVNYG